MSRTLAAAAVLGCLLTMSWPRQVVQAQLGEWPAPEAWSALEKGDAARAAGLFRDALDRSPRNAVLHLGAGWAAHVLGRQDAAISSLKRALEYDPSLAQAAAILAQAAYARGDLDLALSSLERAAELRPRDLALRQQLAQWRNEAVVHASLGESTTTRFRVLFEGTTDPAVRRRVEQTLEAAYWRLGKTLNSYPGEAPAVVLYTDRQFQDVAQLPSWAGGAYDGRIRLAVGGALRTPSALDRLVTHELVHALIAHVAPRNVPVWLHEGLASVLESPDHAWIALALRRVTPAHSLEDLAGGFGHLDGQAALVAYAESAVAANLLLERLGPNLGVFLQMVGTGHTVEQALGTMNVDPEGFHREWKGRVERR
jgi:hypothetical protein